MRVLVGWVEGERVEREGFQTMVDPFEQSSLRTKSGQGDKTLLPLLEIQNSNQCYPYFSTFSCPAFPPSLYNC